jgi:hypothetical protein
LWGREVEMEVMSPGGAAEYRSVKVIVELQADAGPLPAVEVGLAADL